jgi:cytochrome c biogenesis protein CcdA
MNPQMNPLDGYRTFAVSLIMGVGFLAVSYGLGISAIARGSDLTALGALIACIAGGVLTVTGPAAYKSVRTTQALNPEKKGK